MSRTEFERVVAEALDSIPEELGKAMENIVVTVDEEPTREEILDVGLDPDEATLFGLYQGVALPERDPGVYGGVPPDRIVIYRLPLLEACASRRELRREIRDTVVHEVGHYFGLGDEDLP
ncbi:MAG TPA: metallopeptidase family protein [Thermoanaerobaculia bacterium]|nr:metallopeptidase family protein [Thermoanaerobaculia bacterium]